MLPEHSPEYSLHECSPRVLSRVPLQSTLQGTLSGLAGWHPFKRVPSSMSLCVPAACAHLMNGSIPAPPLCEKRGSSPFLTLLLCAALPLPHLTIFPLLHLVTLGGSLATLPPLTFPPCPLCTGGSGVPQDAVRPLSCAAMVLPPAALRAGPRRGTHCWVRYGGSSSRPSQRQGSKVRFPVLGAVVANLSLRPRHPAWRAVISEWHWLIRLCFRERTDSATRVPEVEWEKAWNKANSKVAC